jgi:phospholipid/cholesterol/gamma-HCH transport system permease protein
VPRIGTHRPLRKGAAVATRRLNHPTSLDSRLPGPIARPLSAIGRVGLIASEHAGQIGTLVWNSGIALVRLRVSHREIMRQIFVIGIQSIPIVLITAVLAGTVAGQQGGYQFQSNVPTYIIGSVVTTSMVLEMGPILTAIVLVGRVGARITAELGTMRVSEQIDALYSVGRDPIEILAAPRIVAGIISMPILVAMANLIGVLAGMVAAEATLGLASEGYFYGARLYWHSYDAIYSLTKALAFGFIIPVISIHMGLRTSGGAAGVGKTTTQSVMFMIMTILIVDTMFPPLLLQ